MQITYINKRGSWYLTCLWFCVCPPYRDVFRVPKMHISVQFLILFKIFNNALFGGRDFKNRLRVLIFARNTHWLKKTLKRSVSKRKLVTFSEMRGSILETESFRLQKDLLKDWRIQIGDETNLFDNEISYFRFFFFFLSV